jgi:hypothetical protein
VVTEGVHPLLEYLCFVVLRNGSTLKVFNLAKGLRQAYPLSLFLVLMSIVEGLSRVILEAKTRRVISRVKMGTKLLLSHRIFVNDVLQFIEGTLREDKKIK